MTAAERLERLQAILDDFSCRCWSKAIVLTPEEHEAQAQGAHERHQNAISARRLEEANGTYAVILFGPKAPDWRGQTQGSREIQASAAFTPEGIDRLSDFAIRRQIIAVIMETEFHEILESAQLKSARHRPIIDPHTDRQEVEDTFNMLRQAMISHAVPKE
jgi:hypothetical protein